MLFSAPKVLFVCEISAFFAKNVLFFLERVLFLSAFFFFFAKVHYDPCSSHPITEAKQPWSRLGDHTVEGCNPWKTKCARIPKRDHQWLQNGCALVSDKGLGQLPPELNKNK